VHNKSGKDYFPVKGDNKTMIGEQTIIEAICYVLSKLKRADKIHLVKLIYLADKYHLMNYGRTITDDDFKAFSHGPAGSRTLDVLDFNTFVLGKDDLELAKKLFQQGEGYEYFPGEECLTHQIEMLSESDIEALDFAINNFGRDKWETTNYTHELPEWKQYEDRFKRCLTKREPIKTEELLWSPNDKFFHVPEEHIKQSREILIGTSD
jgi:hypothetical protein